MNFLYDLHPLQIITETIGLSLWAMVAGGIVTESIKNKPIIHRYSNMRFIKNDKVNDWIGVNITKWFVTKTFWRYINKKLWLSKSAGIDRLKEVRFEMTKAEIGHFIAFLVHSLVIVAAIMVRADWELILAFTVANLLLNFYPTLLQQRNKARIDQLINRFNN